VDRFKLEMRHRRLHQQGQPRLVGMQKLFKLVEALKQFIRGRGHKLRVARPRAADPILRASKFPRLLAAAAAGLEQNAVDLTNEP
jgi:hypothetical protein